MTRFRRMVDRGLAGLLAFLMAVAVLNVIWQVFSRYALRSPSAYTDELARFLLIWIGLLGAAYGVGQRRHLSVDLLPTRLNRRVTAAFDVAVDGAVLLFALLVMVFGGGRLVALTISLEQSSPALRLPIGFVYAVVPAAGMLVAFYAAASLATHIRVLRKGACADV